ncbi:serine/threonine-protein kinase [Thermomonospora echinospora]|uniref:serine/threonine-protein kinase n=1 Tax=Thermomonospora echinospora TaxID=1992 RepID=UPI00190E7D02|nr:serine/threonine-protein kinase [Thermomonospora echinospora]
MDAQERSLPAGVVPLMAADPSEVGSYRLLGRLGAGGMGMVYLGEPAADPGEHRLVAVKTLYPAHSLDPEARRRFRAEAAYARRIDSCCTARVIEDGSARTRPYLVTEFIEGPPLSQVVQERGPLPPGSQHAVAIGVADALAAIHRAGVVHRDVKPSNVLLADDGPRIIDFGIAHPLERAEGQTQAGVVMGSPGWIAPERLTGGAAGTSCDVFGWGLLVAYAALGRHPFGEGDGEQLAERILTMPPDLTGMKEPLRSLAEAALAKDPALRPTAEDLLSTLLKPRAEETAALAVAELWTPAPPQAAQEPRAAGEAAPPRRRREPSRRRAGLVTAAVSLGAGAFAGLFVGSGLMNGGASAEPPPRLHVTVTASVPGKPAPESSRPGPATGPAGGPMRDPGVGRPSAGPTSGTETRPARPGAPTPPPEDPAPEPRPSITAPPDEPEPTPSQEPPSDDGNDNDNGSGNGNGKGNGNGNGKGSQQVNEGRAPGGEDR